MARVQGGAPGGAALISVVAEAAEAVLGAASGQVATKRSRAKARAESGPPPGVSGGGSTPNDGTGVGAPGRRTKVVTRGKGSVTPPKGGYAPQPAKKAAGGSTAKKTAAKSTAAPKAGPLDFLHDATLSAEEKLILLLAQQKKDVEKEMQALLDKAEAKQKAAAKKSGGLLGGLKKMKLFDVAKLAMPTLAVWEKTLGRGTIEKLATQLTGPVLGAAAAAMGFPQLAPAAASLGPVLADVAFDLELPIGSAGAASGTDATASTSKDGKVQTLDTVELEKLKLLVNRQQEWASATSNLLQSLHQSRMNVIQNLR